MTVLGYLPLLRTSASLAAYAGVPEAVGTRPDTRQFTQAPDHPVEAITRDALPWLEVGRVYDQRWLDGSSDATAQRKPTVDRF
jgi:hypothetical protein